MNNRETGTHRAIELMELMDPKSQIATCMEWVRFRFRGLVFSLALAGFGKARVIVGRRTFEEQVKLYGQGRKSFELDAIGVGSEYARPHEPRVSWIDPRYSRHVKGLAIDIDFGEYPVESLATIDEVVHQLGITWGGVWSVRDYAHFEI